VFDKENSPKEIHIKTSSILNTFMKNIGVGEYSLTKLEYSSEVKITAQDKEIGTVRYNGFTIFTETLLSVNKNIQRVISDIQTPNTIETSLIIPKDFPVGMIIDLIRKQSGEVLKIEFLEEYTGRELDQNKRSVLIKTYFKQDLSTEEASDIIKQIISNLTRSDNISLRK
jgi:hypothetical protein